MKTISMDRNRGDHNKRFHWVWLAMGLSQMSLLAGCGSGSQSAEDTLFSSIPEQLGLVNVANAAEENQGGLYIPVRISRAFFEKDLLGRIEVRNESGQDLSAIESGVSFQELEPTAPAPTEPFIADFRDRLGCASYHSTGGTELCFNVAPDVSSVDVDARSLVVKGTENLVPPGCAKALSGLKFTKAVRDEGVLTVDFEVQGDMADCAGASALQVKFTLQQL